MWGSARLPSTMCQFSEHLGMQQACQICVSVHPTDVTKLGAHSAVGVSLSFSFLQGFPESWRITRPCQNEHVQMAGKVVHLWRASTYAFCCFFLLEQQVKIQLLIQEAHWEAKDKSTLIFTLGRKGPTKLFKNLEGKEAKEMLLLIH